MVVTAKEQLKSSWWEFSFFNHIFGRIISKLKINLINGELHSLQLRHNSRIQWMSQFQWSVGGAESPAATLADWKRHQLDINNFLYRTAKRSLRGKRMWQNKIFSWCGHGDQNGFKWKPECCFNSLTPEMLTGHHSSTMYAIDVNQLMMFYAVFQHC